MNTKQKIIETAIYLLRTKGYNGWSYDHISKEVGIRKASIHYHFPEKAQLVASAVREYLITFWQFANDVLASQLTSLAKLQKILDLYQKNYASQDEICLCTMLSADYKAVSPEMRDLLQNFYKKLEDWIFVVIKSGMQNGEFKPDIDPKSFACILVNLLQGLLLTGKFSESKYAFQISIEQILSMLKKN